MELKEKNGVCFYQSELLPCPHGFSTRVGGVSEEAHTKSMNLAFFRGDDEQTVFENLRRFTGAVGVSHDSVISLPQIHGSDILIVTHKERGEGYYRRSDRTADGYCTFERGVTLGIKTADCVPILLCAVDGFEAPIAVSALHAGWRGTVGMIARNGVEALIAKGIAPREIRAAIGPAIGGCCYEVDGDFYRIFLSTFGEGIVAETFRPRGKDHYTADLKEINRRILIKAGIPEENIDVSEECTACNPSLFFSHRYSGGVRGTMLSVIALD